MSIIVTLLFSVGALNFFLGFLEGTEKWDTMLPPVVPGQHLHYIPLSWEEKKGGSIPITTLEYSCSQSTEVHGTG